MDDYFGNILEERWLSGIGKTSIKQKLYLFVKYGGVAIGAS